MVQEGADGLVQAAGQSGFPGLELEVRRFFLVEQVPNTLAFHVASGL